MRPANYFSPSTSTAPRDHKGRSHVAPVWTGVEIRFLRLARRMSVRDFAAHLGVSDRMISKWESGGSAIRPRPINQFAMDTSLAQASPQARARFADATGWGEAMDAPTGNPPPDEARATVIPTKPDPGLWHTADIGEALRTRDIPRLFRLLQTYGVSVRDIAALTTQSESDVADIHRGHQVVTYELLVRVATGLGIPRGHLGLAYCSCEDSPAGSQELPVPVLTLVGQKTRRVRR